MQRMKIKLNGRRNSSIGFMNNNQKQAKNIYQQSLKAKVKSNIKKIGNFVPLKERRAVVAEE